MTLKETQSVVTKGEVKWINGAPASLDNQLRQVGNLEKIAGKTNVNTGKLNVFSFLAGITDKETVVRTWKTANFTDNADEKVTVYYPYDVTGDRIMRPGLKFKVEGTFLERLDFLSLMLALFMGTAALPAYSDPLLHGTKSRQCTQINHCGNCCNWFFLYSDSVHGIRCNG